jgi:large subunit ribosomal protein L28
LPKNPFLKSLDPPGLSLHFIRPAGEKPMSRVCAITNARPTKGHIIHRRGMAKKKGGVGRHVTANTPRKFFVNLKTRRIWVSELKRYVVVKLSARAIKTVTKNGAYATLKKAGVL